MSEPRYKQPPNFSYFEWEQNWRSDKIDEQHTLNRDLPPPPDLWVRGNRGAGKNGRGVSVKRSEAIARSRGAKRAATNLSFFVESVLPLIRARLNPAASLALCRELSRPGTSLVEGLLARQLAEEAGWRLWRLDEKSSWIHVDDEERNAQAKAMGAEIDRTCP